MNIKDIARISGVGISTVSRVINNHPDVNQDTRERILEIIKENNYIPNNTARMLKQNNTLYIGVLVKGVFNPFFAEMVKVIGEVLKQSKYTMILQHDDQEDEDIDSLMSFVKEKKLKGVIYLGGNFTEVPDERFKNVGCPIVLVCSNFDYNRENPYFSSVGINDYKAAYDAMCYVMDKEHKDIGILICDKHEKGVGRERLRGCLDAIKDGQLEEGSLSIIEGRYNYDRSYEKTLECLKEHEEITAICALSDIMAIGAARAILDQGHRIGKDIALMGFDGMDVAKYYNPSITTVLQPRKEIALRGIKLLIDLIEKKCLNDHIIIDTVLLERESC